MDHCFYLVTGPFELAQFVLTKSNMGVGCTCLVESQPSI